MLLMNSQFKFSTHEGRSDREAKKVSDKHWKADRIPEGRKEHHKRVDRCFTESLIDILTYTPDGQI